MASLLLINTAVSSDPRAALVVDGSVEEILREHGAAGPQPGDICRGRVVNLEPSVGAAFVDIGSDRNGFLHVSDLPGVGGDGEERARIEDHYAVGDWATVQITRAPVRSKGPVLTSNIGLPGRDLVLLPCEADIGVSRRIDDAEARTRLRDLCAELLADSSFGLILRTAAASASDEAIRADFERLVARWRAIQEIADEGPPRVLLVDSDFAKRAVRELARPDLTRVIVDTEVARGRVETALQEFDLQGGVELELHAGERPLFHEFGIESQIDACSARQVPLPAGGHVVFDRTEALLAIDVNSGRSREGKYLEETAQRTNTEALSVIARHLRLRDEGGVVVVDFIDMKDEANRTALDRDFRRALRGDRARIQFGGLGAFGLYTLTRQRRMPNEDPGVLPRRAAARALREIEERRAGGIKATLGIRTDPETASILESMLGGRGGAVVVPDPALAPGDWAVALP